MSSLARRRARSAGANVYRSVGTTRRGSTVRNEASGSFERRQPLEAARLGGEHEPRSQSAKPGQTLRKRHHGALGIVPGAAVVHRGGGRGSSASSRKFSIREGGAFWAAVLSAARTRSRLGQATDCAGHVGRLRVRRLAFAIVNFRRAVSRHLIDKPKRRARPGFASASRGRTPVAVPHRPCPCRWRRRANRSIAIELHEDVVAVRAARRSPPFKAMATSTPSSTPTNISRAP